MQVNYTVDPNSDAGKSLLKIIKWMLNGMIVFGILCLAAAIVTLVLTLTGGRNLVETQGAIVGFTASGAPTVEYEVDGETYRFVSNISSSAYRQGQAFTVQYPASDPADGRAASGRFVAPIVFGAIGAGFTLIPLLLKWVFGKAFAPSVENREENAPVRL